MIGISSWCPLSAPTDSMKRSVLLRVMCPCTLYRGAFGAECAPCQLAYICTPVLVTDDPRYREQCYSDNYRTQVNLTYLLVTWLIGDLVTLPAMTKLDSSGPKSAKETHARKKEEEQKLQGLGLDTSIPYQCNGLFKYFFFMFKNFTL